MMDAMPRALVIDDNELNIELARFLLEADGFAVESALHAHDGLALIARSRPDVVLMDIQMPDMDGLALTRLLKADAQTRAIPVIAFTAFAMKGDEAKMRAAGCDDYISKPIDVARFAATVRECVQRHGPSTGLALAV